MTLQYTYTLIVADEVLRSVKGKLIAAVLYRATGHKKRSRMAQSFLDGCCAAVFLSKHSEQMPACFFHKPLKKCLRHKILRHCLHAAPLNSPKVRLQIAHITGAIEIAM
jgi:hypothetical protein